MTPDPRLTFTDDVPIMDEEETGTAPNSSESWAEANAESKSTRGDREDQSITAEEYFNRVKAGLQPIAQEILAQRLEKLTYALEAADRGQRAFKAETQRQIAILVMQQKIASLGWGEWVSREAIDKFRMLVEMRCPEMCRLEQFTRAIPPLVQGTLAQARVSEVFDSFWILTWNPSEEQVASVTDRIIKKDPILFGQIAFDPDRFYYLTSWEDEACDLTFDKMIDQIQTTYPAYQPGTVKPLDKESIDYVLRVTREKQRRLEATGPRRYRSDAIITMLQEERFSWPVAKQVLKSLWAQFRTRKKC